MLSYYHIFFDDYFDICIDDYFDICIGKYEQMMDCDYLAENW